MSMRLFKTFVFSILFSLAAQAESFASCNALLSSGESNLSVSSQAYVSLVQFYMNQSIGQENEKVFAKIFASGQFVNPFEEKDSLSVQLSIAIEQLRQDIDTNEWESIKTKLLTLNKQRKTENGDRVEKEHSTSFVMLTEPEKIGAHPFLIGQNLFYPRIEVIKGRVFITLGTESHASLFEIKNGELVRLAEKYAQTPFVLKLVGERILVTYGSGSNLHLDELIGDELHHMSYMGVMSGGYFTTEVNWFSVGDRVFISCGTQSYLKDRNLRIYEVVDGKLRNTLAMRMYYNFKSRINHIDWFSFKERTFLTLGDDDSGLNLFELIDDVLVPSDTKLEGTKSEWHIINDKPHLLITGSDQITLYELADGKFNISAQLNLKRADLLSSFLTPPSLKIVNNQIFIALGVRGARITAFSIFLYEVINGEFVIRSEVPGWYSFPPSWQEISGHIFLSVSGGRDLLLYELVDGRLNLFKKIADKQDISFAGLKATDNGSYLITYTQHKKASTLNVFQMTKKLKKTDSK